MITAIDTNVLLDVWAGSRFAAVAGNALARASTSGPLVICEVVRAEAAVAFASRRALDDFLDALGIATQPLGNEACWLAARAWSEYRRRGGARVRILPDFLIAGHALSRANRLLTRDRGFFRGVGGLAVWDPAMDAAKD